MIAHDGVHQKLVGPVAAAWWSAEGPDVVDDRAQHPRAFILLYECRRRAGAPFVDADRQVRRRGIIEQRPDTPVETLAVLRRQKECYITIGEPRGPVLAEFFRRLRFTRELGPSD